MSRFALSIGAATLASLAPAAAQGQYQQPYQQPYEQPYPQPYEQPYQQPYQQQYPVPYQQQYPQYPQYPGQQGYGSQDQYYGNQNILGSFVDQLIGNRYDVGDRQAIHSCAYAAVREAENRYRPYFNGLPYAYQGYRSHVRVSDISSVQRRLLVTRVRGYLHTTRGWHRDRDYRDRDYREPDLSFRCDVDHRGNIADLRIERTRYWRD